MDLVGSLPLSRKHSYLLCSRPSSRLAPLRSTRPIRYPFLSRALPTAPLTVHNESAWCSLSFAPRKYAASALQPRPPAGGSDSDFEEELRLETEETLEWARVCQQVARFASTAAGRRALCEGLRLGTDRQESRRLLDQTSAAKALPRRLNFSGVKDVSGFVQAAAAGEVLGVRELCAVERSLRATSRVYEELVEVAEAEGPSYRYLPLLDIFRSCNFLTELVEEIQFCIDCSLSTVLDRASSNLERIRSKRRENTGKLESLLKNVSTEIFHAGGINSPLVTRRRSRLCVGIRASHKSVLPDAVVLGVSSSGATYFMEPREAIEMNNAEVRLSSSEKAEELAILSKLTSQIAGSKSQIEYLMDRLLELDLAVSRGGHAIWMNSVLPSFGDTDTCFSADNQETYLVDIEGIFHPLLLEPSLRETLPSLENYMPDYSETGRENQSLEYNREGGGQCVIPIDIKIKKSSHVVVISGPNTGGKTVAMKTLGLAALMAKAGLYVPAKSCSCIPWFDQILADIGDHQSLEHNLSTFSGHMIRVRKILEVASVKSLVLIDEIGNGTDPSEGMALSFSILQHIVNKVNLAVVTTHFADLSSLKCRDSRFENAAMEFCTETLKPTYSILWGSSGNSNALSIAKTIGFNQEVIDRAHEWANKLLPDKQNERQGMLYQSLLKESSFLEAQAKKAMTIFSAAEMLHNEICLEAEDLDSREASLKEKETRKIRNEIKSIKFQLDQITKNFEREIQSTDPNRFNALVKKADTAVTSLVEANRSDYDVADSKYDNSSSYVPQIGDSVQVKRLGGKIATVIKTAEADNVVIQYGKIKARVKRNELRLISDTSKDLQLRSNLDTKWKSRELRADRTTSETTNNNGQVLYAPAIQTSKNTVDLRGMRVEEASNHLNMAISGCRPYGVLFIIHGMGTGAVKECALDILRKHPRVTNFDDASPANYGCTVASIK